MRSLVRKHRRKLALAVSAVCMAGAVGAVWYQDHVNQDTSAKLGASTQVTIAGCQRLNVQIVQSNRASAALYPLLSLTVTDLGGHGTVPGVAPYVQLLRAARDAQRWIMPTACAVSVAAHGAHYKLANPVRFSKSQPPPEALTFPAGS